MKLARLQLTGNRLSINGANITILLSLLPSTSCLPQLLIDYCRDLLYSNSLLHILANSFNHRPQAKILGAVTEQFK